jgi:hypothetical protein
MRTFIIDSDNNITAFASEQQAKVRDATGGESFTTQDEMTKLAAAWPGGRLVEVWNSLTGVDPVKKFTDRKTAVARIWKAVQSLQPGSEESPKKASTARDVRPRSTKLAKATNKARKPKKAAKEAKGPRHDTKQAKVLELLRRDGGVTLDALVKETGWKPNSVRGFVSGAIGKKLGLKVESSKREAGMRVYQIA